MATLQNKFTIQNVMAATTNDGDMLEIADVLSQTNDLMRVLPWHPTNEALIHRTGRVTSFGTPTPVVANEGATSIINETEQVIDTPIYYHNIVNPDPRVLVGVNDVGEWRAEQVKYYGMSYAEAIAAQVITGDSLTTPGKSIDGLARRLGSLPTSATDVTDRYYTVQSAGGTGSDNTSVYVLGLGKNGVYGIYSKNGMAGFQYSLLPQQLVAVGNGHINVQPIDVSWEIGLCATNYRAMGRLANIDVSDLTDNASAGANLVNELTHLMNKVKYSNMGLTPVLLANQTVISFFETQRINFGGNSLGQTTDLGRFLTTFKNVPFLQMDSIGVAEATIS